MVLAAATLFAYGLHRLNKQEILLTSERLIDTRGSALESEQVPITVNVMGSMGVRPHVFGVLCAWLTYSLLATTLLDMPSTWVLRIVPAVVYFLVLIVWTNAILKKRFSFSLWRERLNRQRERLKEAPTYAETEKYLQNARKKLQWREILPQTGLLLFMTIALWGTTLGGTQFPLSLVLLFTAFLFATCSENFFVQLRNFFLSRFAFQIEEVDLAKLFEPEQDESSRIEKMTRRIRNKIEPILAAIAAFLAVLLKLKDLIGMLSEIVDWGRHLF